MLPLTELRKTMPETARTPKGPGNPFGKPNSPWPIWEWTREAEQAFQMLKMAFTEAPIFHHFHPAKLLIVQTDASGFAIAGILTW